MSQKPPSKEDLLALTNETLDRMEGDPEVIEMMRALWKLSIELEQEAELADVRKIVH